MIRFFREGAVAGQRLLYVADKAETELADDLAPLSSRDAMLGSGQLKLLPLAKLYGSVDDFTADEQIAMFKELTATAVRAGFGCLRVAAEATSLFVGVDAEHAARRFVGYEVGIDRVMATEPMLSMCGYDRRLVSAAAASALCLVHPLRHGARIGSACGVFAEEDGSWSVTGEIDLVSRDSFETALSVLSELPGDRDITLRLEGLTFIDVAGVRALAELSARLAPRRLILHDPPTPLRRILRLWWQDLPGLEVAD